MHIAAASTTPKSVRRHGAAASSGETLGVRTAVQKITITIAAQSMPEIWDSVDGTHHRCFCVLSCAFVCFNTCAPFSWDGTRSTLVLVVLLGFRHASINTQWYDYNTIELVDYKPLCSTKHFAIVLYSTKYN